MANVLSDDKKQQVVALGKLGWALRRIEQATGVRRETAGAYLRAAGIAVRPAGRWGHPLPKPAIEVSTGPAAAESNPAIEVSTGSGGEPVMTPEPAPPSRSPSASACEAYREVIEEALSRGRNAMAIWQDLVDDHGFSARYSSVKRYVHKLQGEAPPEARVVIETPAGQEGQVDYGEGPMVRNPLTGKYQRTRLFVFTLGFSRKSIRLLAWKSSSRAWAELHESSFRRLGGAPRIIVLDNLREGVLTPDIYDPSLNPLYRDVLKHYGAVAIPCRVRDPDRKGKVESGVGHAQKTPLKGLRFESLEEAQAYLDRWEERWADKRIHGTRKRQVSAMFAEELPSLLTLPLEPFRYYAFGKRTVHLDGFVEVDAAYYAPPPGHIGRELDVQWDGRVVRILDPRTGLLLREHLRQERGHRRMRPEDQPKRTPATTEQLLVRSANVGVSIGILCRGIHSQDGELGVRSILGVLSLAKKHGPAQTNEACAAAIEIGVPTYRFVRRYLQHRAPLQQQALKQVDPLIRQLTLYRDLINLRTKEPS
jgi:transposase